MEEEELVKSRDQKNAYTEGSHTISGSTDAKSVRNK
jgi:hypothetical protein